LVGNKISFGRSSVQLAYKVLDPKNRSVKTSAWKEVEERDMRNRIKAHRNIII